MKNFKSAQYKYDNMNDDEEEHCPVCGNKIRFNTAMGSWVCIDVEYCGWEKDDDI